MAMVRFGRDTDVWLGQRFGGYRIVEVLGKGAVATVYRALDREDVEIALKVLNPMAEANRAVRELFEQEWRLTSRLDHPGVVAAYDYGEVGGSHYLAMQLVPGSTVADRLAPDRRLEEPVAVEVAAQAAEALAHVHEHGVVHRDIKPANLLVTDEDRALVFDFGLALDLTDPPTPDGQVYGSPFYLSPEQARGEMVDGRADLYGLGGTLFRMLTGRAPFYGERRDLLDAHLHQPPPDPAEVAGTSPELAAVVLAAMAKNPAQRYADGHQMAAALRGAELSEPSRRSWFRRR